MKKNVFTSACLTMVLASCLLTSCNESAELRTAKGGYHYKTSGQVTVCEPNQPNKIMTLNNESGVMEVVSLYDDDKLLLTFNQTNGGVYNTHGTISDKTLTFDAFERTLSMTFPVVKSDTIHIYDLLGVNILRDSIVSLTKYETEVFDLNVSGTADVYENNIIFNLSYSGSSQSSDKTLSGKNIQTLAKKN